MAPPSSIDDPNALNRFLAIIGGASLSESASDSGFVSYGTTSPPETTTPPLGARAPPPTPASAASGPTYGNDFHLESIPDEALDHQVSTQLDTVPEDEVTETTFEELTLVEPGTGVTDKELAVASTLSSVEVTPGKASPEVGHVFTPKDEDQLDALVALANKSTENLSHSKHAPCRQVPVVTAKSTKSGWDTWARLSSSSKPLSNNPNKPTIVPLAPKPELVVDMQSSTTSSDFQDSIVAKFRQSHSPFPDAEVEPQTNGKAVEFNNLIKVQDEVTDSGKQSANPTPTGAPQAATTSDAEDAADSEDEGRENASFFKSWGTAAVRTTPKAVVRTVFITNIPSAADATLICSLISGGAIETMSITSGTAKVTFTTGADAKSFYDKYPNGIDYVFQGQRRCSQVDIGTNVDVVSGLMRGYLESGASRVVRAVGADEDWGMRALNVIAGGKGRKLEAIIDKYRNEVRTIDFRFTNIPAAVQFKGELIRDDDWELCEISFGVDPCQKATSVHMES